MYEFSNQKPINNIGRQWQADILAGKQGTAATYKNNPTTIKALYKFFVNQMIDLILGRTNAKKEKKSFTTLRNNCFPKKRLWKKPLQ